MSDSVGDPVTGKSRLLSEQCGTCVFRPGNLMHLRSGRLKDLVDEARANEGFVVCHDTLSYARTKADPAVCRGFYDRYKTQALQLIERLWGWQITEPPNPCHDP